MYHLRLIKALSYTGVVEATKQRPDVYVEDKAIADAAVATGYFKLIKDEGEEFILEELFQRILAEEAEKTQDNEEKECAIPLHKELRLTAPDENEEKTPNEEENKMNEVEEKKSEKPLEEMTVPELETFAAYKGISLKGISKKADIIAKLKTELDEKETENEVDYGSPTMTELQGQ